MPKTSLKATHTPVLRGQITSSHPHPSPDSKPLALAAVLDEQEKLLVVLGENIAALGSNIERYLPPTCGLQATLHANLEYTESQMTSHARNNNERIQTLINVIGELSARASVS